ncbi:MAG TPA: Spy/CpxP family protein refolding chaperone [Bacteroidia bacterium]|nr:Spy/CpxP family protein refolding chaperone [Bacteroidia bacterium]HNT80158.1 Spy/CpxP family protein refolding chaperone [Bacteroidia bacterium]
MKKVKLLIAVLALLFPSMELLAQPGKENREEKIEAMKIGFITKRLDLTSAEAQKFWPVYNKMQDEMRAIHKTRKKDFKEAMADIGNMSDQEVEKLIDDDLAFKQQNVDLMKKYHAQFKQVLPVKKVALLYHAEEDFRRELLRQLQSRDNKPPPHDRMRK